MTAPPPPNHTDPTAADPSAVSNTGARADPSPRPDIRSWVTLAIVLMSTVIIVLDNTVLNVAIPTILQEFHTSLPSLEWVITGYSLTFATFLIIGGRLGDIYGQRRMFIIGASLFTVGSLIASLSWNVASLVVGEALIEGMGASLMLPATLALLSNTFQGRERAMAFAAWGAVAGSAAGLGPVVGGFLTTDFSWRWAFRINVIIAPLAIIGALFFIAKMPSKGKREPLDGPGAALIAIGMFLLVFGLSEGGTYGWLTPISGVTLGSLQLWSADAPLSIIPLVFAGSFVALFSFYRHERARERSRRSPLFEFGLLEHRTFRYGLIVSLFTSMGQLGLSFALALFLQESKHLSALDNGLWILPYGLSILIGAPIAGRLTNRIGPAMVIRIGLAMQTVALVYIAASVSPSLRFAQLLPGLVVYGLGAGFAFTQLVNVVLSEIPPDKSGVASGTNSTLRQVGNALGIAVIGTLVTTLTVNRAVSTVSASRKIPRGIGRQAAVQIRAYGANYRPAPGLARGVSTELGRVVSNSVSSATHDAVLFATVVVFFGALLSLLIPSKMIMPATADTELATELGGLGPIDPESEILAPTGAEGMH